MKKLKIISKYSVERQKPVNYDHKDESLIVHEFEKEFDQVYLFSTKRAWIDSGGIIANALMAIQSTSLVNLRQEGNLSFLLGHYPRMVLKLPRVKWEDYLWISERWSHGYFHWLCDALPRYYILNKELQKNTILLPQHYSEYRYVLESLNYLGLSYDFIPRGSKYLTKSVSFATPVSGTGNFYPPVMKTIREVFLSKQSDHPTEHRRVYISRKHAKVRRIVNESECEEVFKSFGVETVYLEKLDFADQMKLMAKTELLIGVHGAGLTNMLACPSRCRVLEIRGATDNTNNCFFSLASALELDYYYLLAKENPTPHDKVGDVYVDPNKLKDTLEQYFPV